MTARCPECGAPVSSGTSCRENFHALLALEWEIPGGAGTLAHFFAVSAYGLQHPDSMNYTVEAIGWLESAVLRALETGCSVEDLRESARTQGESAHVTRRSGEPVPSWDVTDWTTNVADVLSGGTEGYGERVRAWAASVVEDIHRARRA